MQKAMSAVTPPDHGAHLASPAIRVDANAKRRLRRKQERDCGILENKTPAKRPAGAACDVVDTRSDIASKRNNITLGWPCAIVSKRIAQKDARKRGAPRAECRTGNCAPASEKNLNTVSKLKSIGGRNVIHHNILSDPTSEKKNPAIEQSVARASS